MKIKFWGARGSTPTPERRNSRYGGNTSCLEVRLGNGTLIVLDCGSGFRALGKSLLRECGERPIQAYVFVTHFHWDHIQGIPFFLPLYRRGNMFMFHSVMREEAELKQAIEGQMMNPYFPVDMSVMGASRHFFDLDYGPININGAIISSAPLNHPQSCVGFRIEADGAVFVLATDTEPGSPFHDQSVRDLARGADVLVYDAQYTPEQLAGDRRGWGHSSWYEGTQIARHSGVKRLVLFHHDPDHDDAFVDGLVEKASQEFRNVIGAAEGLEIRLPEGAIERASVAGEIDRRRERRYQVQLPVRVAWRSSGGERVRTEGLTQDVSRSGIYFVSPKEIDTDQPFELEIILPDEITSQGDLILHRLAEAIRRERVNGTLATNTPRAGVAAQLIAPESDPHSEEKLPSDEIPR